MRCARDLTSRFQARAQATNQCQSSASGKKSIIRPMLTFIELNSIGLQFQVPVTLLSSGVTTAYASTMISSMMEKMTVVITVMKQATVSYIADVDPPPHKTKQNISGHIIMRIDEPMRDLHF